MTVIGCACGAMVGRVDDPGPAPVLQLLVGCLCAALAPHAVRLAPRGNEVWLGLVPVAAMVGTLLWSRSGRLSSMDPSFIPAGGREVGRGPVVFIDGTWAGVALIWAAVALSVSLYIRAARREGGSHPPIHTGAAGHTRDAGSEGP